MMLFYELVYIEVVPVCPRPFGGVEHNRFRRRKPRGSTKLFSRKILLFVRINIKLREPAHKNVSAGDELVFYEIFPHVLVVQDKHIGRRGEKEPPYRIPALRH